MRATAAFRDGLRRVNGAPVLLAGMCLVTLLVALPLTLVVREAIESHLGTSVVAERVADGIDYDWWQEFTAHARGAGATFVPSIIGFGVVLGNLSAFLDNRPAATAVAGVIAVWLVVWSFLSGGVLDRLARQRPTRAAGFFAACGTHVWRFARLGLVAWIGYAALFGYVHPWLFDDLYPWLTADTSVERQAFLVRLGGYLAFGLLLGVVNVVFDYARVRIVVEDRRSALGAIAAGARFVRRHPGKVATLYLLNVLLFLVVILLYALVAPGAPGRGLHGWLVLALGQAYIVARHYAKLVFYASETALFQGELAHATYTAAPALVWPDSPAAEAILNAEPALGREI